MKNQRKKTRTPRIRSDGYAKDIVYSLEIDCIRANAAQPRRDFDMESIIKLADSIRRYGILQPLSVRRARPEPPTDHSHRKKNIVADVLSASLSFDVSRETSRQEVSGEPVPRVSRETKIAAEGAPFDRVSRETQENTGGENDNVSRETCAENYREAFQNYGFEQLSFENLPKTAILEQNRADLPTLGLPDDTHQYELVAGERRLRAAKMLGMRYVPCIIVDVNDAISAELALVENMLRENLNMFEQAAAFSHLADKYALTQEEIALKMSLSQSAVANKIRLLKLSEAERQLIMDADLTERHARAFLRVGDMDAREACIRWVIDNKLNVSDTDKYITALLSQGNALQKDKQTPPQASPEKLCTNIYKFVNRMQSTSGGYLTVNRRSDDKNVIITLTVRKGS